MKLAEVKAGREVKVVEIYGGFGIRRKLASVGIFPGVKVKVVKNPPGPVIVETSGTRFAIGMGMARKIEVELE